MTQPTLLERRRKPSRQDSTRIPHTSSDTCSTSTSNNVERFKEPVLMPVGKASGTFFTIPRLKGLRALKEVPVSLLGSNLLVQND